MKQKLIAAAVAGAFVMPGVALAQVTISGQFAVGLSQGKVSDPAVGRTGFNTSSHYIESAGALRFAMQENLGGGTSFTGLWEMRPILDATTTAATDQLSVGSTSPQAWVGLRNAAWGQLRAGAITVWGARGSVSGPTGFHYGASNVTDYVQTSAVGNASSAASGRQRNVILYETPKFGGFQMNVAYSTANNGNDADFQGGNRKGSAWYLAPEYNAGDFTFGMVHANQKPDNATSHTKGNKFYVNGSFGAIRAGVTYVNWKGETATGLNDLSQTSYAIPVSYVTGPHTFGVVLGKANDNKNLAGDQSAKQTAVAYNYAFSKRTRLSLTHSRLKNGAGAAFDLPSLTSQKEGVNGFTTALGEDLTSTTIGLHHSF